MGWKKPLNLPKVYACGEGELITGSNEVRSYVYHRIELGERENERGDIL